jgi:hypothetical protein
MIAMLQTTYVLKQFLPLLDNETKSDWNNENTKPEITVVYSNISQRIQTIEHSNDDNHATSQHGRWSEIWLVTTTTTTTITTATTTTSPCSRGLPEKLIGPLLLKKFTAFYTIRNFIITLTRAPTCPYPEPDLSSPCTPSHSSKIHFNIILPSAPRSYKGLLPSGFSTKTPYAPLLCPIRATCPAHLSSCFDKKQKYLLESKGGPYVELITLPAASADCLEILGAATSWVPTSVSRSV